MTRNRASAKKAGTEQENRAVAALQHVNPDICRRTKTGAKDRGDVHGLHHMGIRIVVEVKNEATVKLAGWAAEAETERLNDDAGAAVVYHKRHGKTDPLEQWVTMTARDFVAILTGERP